MGRKTWESLPFPLPGRPNLVLTRDEKYQASKAEVFRDIRSFVGRGYELAGENGSEEVIIIGGAQLYELLMPYIERQYITQISEEVEGDAIFPAPDKKEWVLSSSRSGLKTEKDDYDFKFEVWDRL